MQTARIQYNFCLYTSRPTFFPREVCSLPHSLFHSFIHPSIHPSIWEHVHSLSLVLSLPSSIHTIFAERDRAWLSPASLQDPAGSSEPEIDHAPVTRVALHRTARQTSSVSGHLLYSFQYWASMGYIGLHSKFLLVFPRILKGPKWVSRICG